MNFKKPPDDIEETFGLTWQDVLREMGVGNVSNALNQLGATLLPTSLISNLLQPIRGPMQQLETGFTNIANSIGAEFNEKENNNLGRDGYIWKFANDMWDFILDLLNLRNLMTMIKDAVLTPILYVMQGLITDLALPIIGLFKLAFGWIFDPINAAFSSGYDFFISTCYVCVIIQLLRILLEIVSIARIIAG